MTLPSNSDDDQLQLFDLPDENFERGKPLRFLPLEKPVWTRHKANLVALYVKHFLYITHHGTYIDAFAGRQNPDDDTTTDPDSADAESGWAAELVLGIEPQWLRHFYFFERNPTSHTQLVELGARYPKRDIRIGPPGDCNTVLPEVLPERSLKATEATFCLLDQRTFECSWALCRHVSRLKQGSDRKVEQFYFLAQGWLDRSFEATSTTAGYKAIERWWGRDDWQQLRTMRGQQRADVFCQRFKEELGYRFAIPWPIFKSARRGGPVMYFMIHATDHAEGPALMRRSYNKAVLAPPIEQLQLDLELDTATFSALAEAYHVDEPGPQ